VNGEWLLAELGEQGIATGAPAPDPPQCCFRPSDSLSSQRSHRLVRIPWRRRVETHLSANARSPNISVFGPIITALWVGYKSDNFILLNIFRNSIEKIDFSSFLVCNILLV